MAAVDSEDAWQRRLENAVSGVANALSGIEPAGRAADAGWVRPRSGGGFVHQTAVGRAVQAQQVGSGAPVAAAAIAGVPRHAPHDADALSEWQARQHLAQIRQSQESNPGAAAASPPRAARQAPARRLGGMNSQDEQAYNLSVYGDPNGPDPAAAAASPSAAGGIGASPLADNGPTPQQRRVAEAVRARAAAAQDGGGAAQRSSPRLLPVRESSQSVLDQLTAGDEDEDDLETITRPSGGAAYELRTRAQTREVSQELQMERQYREGIEAALQAEVSYRDQLKTGLEAQLQEERGKRERAEAIMNAKSDEARDERAKRVSAEEELRRVKLELEAANDRMGEYQRMADGACADLAAEKQQSRRAKSDLQQTSEYSRELEALYRAGLQNSHRTTN